MPIVPQIPNPLFPGVDKAPRVDDMLVKDERVRVSEILARNGFPRHIARSQGAPLALAESGADPERENTSANCSAQGDRAIGLMQICTIHRGSFGVPRDMDKAVQWLKNPDNNASVAYKIWLSAGGTFARDWEAFQTGAWTKFRGQDPVITVRKKTASGAIGDAAGDAVDKALGPLDEIGAALLSPDTWFRLFKGGGGAVLIAMGAAGLVFIVATRAAKTAPAKSAIKAASNVVPAGKAAKIVKAAGKTT